MISNILGCFMAVVFGLSLIVYGVIYYRRAKYSNEYPEDSSYARHEHPQDSFGRAKERDRIREELSADTARLRAAGKEWQDRFTRAYNEAPDKWDDPSRKRSTK